MITMSRLKLLLTIAGIGSFLLWDVVASTDSSLTTTTGEEDPHYPLPSWTTVVGVEDYENNNNTLVDENHHDYDREIIRRMDESAGLEFDDKSGIPMLEVIRTSMQVYGTLFAIYFFAYCIGRKLYPQAYNVLGSVEEYRTPLTDNFYGVFDWIYGVFTPTDEDIFVHCGMDAIVFIRSLRFGFRVACVGIFNSFFLIPVCVTAAGGQTQLEATALANLPNGDPAFLAAVLASYILFGSAMLLLYKEFDWFTKHRHRFLAQPRPDNYTIYVKNIPPALQCDHALLQYFRNIFNNDKAAVREAKVALDIPNLEKMCAEREALVNKLEHAYNIWNFKGIRPKHIVIDIKNNKKGCFKKGESVGPPSVDSIDTWTAQLDELNDAISNAIQQIEDHKKTLKLEYKNNENNMMTFKSDLQAALEEQATALIKQQQQANSMEEKQTLLTIQETYYNNHDDYVGAVKAISLLKGDSPVAANDSGSRTENEGFFESHKIDEEHGEDILKNNNKDEEQGLQRNNKDDTEDNGNNSMSTSTDSTSTKLSRNPLKASTQIASHVAKSAVKESANTLKASSKLATNVAKTAVKESTNTIKASGKLATNVTKTAAAFITGSEDGKPRNAGFVTFSTLKAKTFALQMIHDETPFTMSVEEAPLPKDIFWGNVGLSHYTQQVGIVVGNALTVALCMFWTLLVASFTALGEVDKLKRNLPFLEHWIEAQPWIEMVLKQVKPLLLVVIVALLPVILTAFSKREGHISEATLSAVVFYKLSIFLLVQLFFVQMIAGVLLSSMREMIEIIGDPFAIVTALADEVPKQVQSFMQYVIVQTSLNLGKEIIRIPQIVKAFIRNRYGPNFTEKESQQPWMGLTPLSVAEEFNYADVQANLILYFMITFAYSGLAPIVSFVMAIAFVLLSLIYRNQLIYVYSPANDTGGQLFNQFAKLIMTCMITAEIIMFGVLSMKQASIAAPFYIPLIVITVMFSMYLKQEHYTVSKHLPSKVCVQEDIKNRYNATFNFKDFSPYGSYAQPALQVRKLKPYNKIPPDNILSFDNNEDGDADDDDCQNHIQQRLLLLQDLESNNHDAENYEALHSFFFTPDNSELEVEQEYYS